MPADVPTKALQVTLEPYYIKGELLSACALSVYFCVHDQLDCGHAKATWVPSSKTHAVEHKETGEVYLEGELERGIIPEDSVWMHGHGPAEDGFMFYLKKMNLELLQEYASLPCRSSSTGGDGGQVTELAVSCVKVLAALQHVVAAPVQAPWRAGVGRLRQGLQRPAA